MIIPCHGKADLFEATTRAAHEAARALCATCPLFTSGECEARLQAAMREYGYGPNVGPRGTWAGRLISQPEETVVPMGGAA